MPPVSTAAIGTTAPSTLATLKQEFKDDGSEILYRSVARTANKTAKSLIAKYLVDRLPKAKRRTAASVIAMCFDTEAGTAAVGLVLSLLPTASQTLLGKQLPPKLLRLARECRREGGVEVVSRVMDEAVNLVRLLVDMGEQYLKALPDDGTSGQEVAVKETVEALPPGQKVDVTASAMFAGLDVETVPVRG